MSCCAARGLFPVRPTTRRRPGGILTRYPNHFNWLLSVRRNRGSTPTPSLSRMSKLCTLSSALAQRPEEKIHFSRSYRRSHSFCAVTQTHDHWWRLELKSASKSPRQPVQWPYYCCSTAYMLHLPSLVNKVLRYLNSSTWGSNSVPIRSG